LYSQDLPPRQIGAELGVTATRLVISFAVPASAWGAAWVNRFMDKAFSYRWFGER
jgi:hypothetical protein